MNVNKNKFNKFLSKSSYIPKIDNQEFVMFVPLFPKIPETEAKKTFINDCFQFGMFDHVTVGDCFFACLDAVGFIASMKWHKMIED